MKKVPSLKPFYEYPIDFVFYFQRMPTLISFMNCLRMLKSFSSLCAKHVNCMWNYICTVQYICCFTSDNFHAPHLSFVNRHLCSDFGALINFTISSSYLAAHDIWVVKFWRNLQTLEIMCFAHRCFFWPKMIYISYYVTDIIYYYRFCYGGPGSLQLKWCKSKPLEGSRYEERV